MEEIADECIELKNIKYKTMLLNGAPIKETKSINDLSNLELFLEEENINNQNEPWTKLNKTQKTKKILDFIETYVKKQKYDETECAQLTLFLKDCLEKKRLSRVKDVIYDKTTGEITSIPGIVYNKSTNHFTLKYCDKRVSTLKNLPPKKNLSKDKPLVIV
jgi:hypothetical protein